MTLTATVDAGGKPAATGTINFTDGVTALGSAPLTKADLGSAKIAAGGYHTCAIANNGRVYCWGSGLSGQLGHGAFANSTTPVQVSGITNAIAVAVGGAHSCAVLATGAVRCWGAGTSGQLGHGVMAGSNVPVDVQNLAGASMISAGVDFSCAVVPGTNSVLCWGANGNGQLGSGTFNAGSPFPQLVLGGSGAVQIASGGYHSCLLNTVGSVRCWGKGTDHQLGYGTAADWASPREVLALDGFTEAGTGSEFFFTASHISLGHSHSCAVVPNPSSPTSARVYCWGRNDTGQLGRDPALTSGSIPQYTSRYARPVIHWSGSSYYSGAATLGAGLGHTCVRQVNDYILCFGQGASGQIGNNNTVDTYAPAVIVPLTGAADGFAQVASGNSHSCGLRSTGEVECWGRGDEGQLGRGNTTSVNTRPDVVSNFDARTLSTASLSTSTLAPGARTLGATFAATGTHAASSATFAHTVTRASQTISFGNVIPTNAVFGGQYTTVATATSSLPVVISIDPASASVCSLSASTVSFIGVGTCTVNADQAGDSTYLPAPRVSQSFTVNKRNQPLYFSPVAAQTYAPGATVVVDATALPGLPVTFTSTTPTVCSVSVGTPVGFVYQSTATLLGAGTCSITASQPGDANTNPATPVAQSFAISKGAQTISFSAPAAQTFATNKIVALSASATSGLAVAFSSTTPAVCTVAGSSATLIAVGTCSITAAQAGNANFNAATSVAQSFAISKGTQTITFAAPAAQTFATNKIVALSASATSGLAVAFSSTTPAVCTVAGSSATLIAVGTCSITAAQAGNANFNAAASVAQSFAISKGAQTITFAAPAAQTFATNKLVDLPASASSGLAVTRSSTTPAVCTISATSALLVSVGTCTITVAQAGDTNFNAATSVTQSFAISKGAQTITFDAPAGQVFETNKLVALPASASSGLAVTRSSTTPAVCTISGTSALLLSVGTCSITVAQAGDANFNAATSVTQSFAVAMGTQTITFDQPAAQIFATGKLVALPATASSGLAVTRASSTPATCTISGAAAVLVGVGTCTVVVAQPGDSRFLAATPVTRSFLVSKGTQTITFNQPADQIFATGRLVSLTATASSALVVTRSSSTPTVCTISGTSALVVGIGTCTVTAAQAGTATFNPAASVTRSFVITAALGAEVSALAATARLHEQSSAAIAPFGSGAVMAYASRSTATGPFGVMRQTLSVTGAASGVPDVVAAPAAGVSEPHVAALKFGYVIVWAGADASGTGIFAQRYTSSGLKTGSVIQLNGVSTGAQSRPRVAALPSGGFAVVWQTTVSATDQDVFMRVFSAAGTPITADVRVNTTLPLRQSNPDIAALASGTFAVTFANETSANRYGVYHRLFTATGAPMTAQIATAWLNQALSPTPVIAARTGAGAASGFAIAYASSEVASVATPADISVKTVSATGVASTTAIKVNTILAGHQFAPAIAPLQAGAFAVAFVTPDGSSTGIGLRLFSPTAAPLGTEEAANTVTALTQAAPELAPLGAAGADRGDTFLGVWTTQSPTPANGTDIAAQRFQGP